MQTVFCRRCKPNRGEAAGNTYYSIRAIHTSPSEDCKNTRAISPAGRVRQQLPVSPFLHSTRGFCHLYIAPPPPCPIQVDDQQFRGEARENKDLSYRIRVIWAHIEWGRGDQEDRGDTRQLQRRHSSAAARLSGQTLTGCYKRLAQWLVLNCTFVHQLTCLRALLCKRKFAKRDKHVRWVVGR